MSPASYRTAPPRVDMTTIQGPHWPPAGPPPHRHRPQQTCSHHPRSRTATKITQSNRSPVIGPLNAATVGGAAGEALPAGGSGVDPRANAKEARPALSAD